MSIGVPVRNGPVNFIDPGGQSLRSAWNSVKSAAKNTVTFVKNTVRNVFSGSLKVKIQCKTNADKYKS